MSELQKNAFYLLGVSVRSNRDEIAAAYEDALVSSQHDERILQQAQQILLTPRTRLASEIAWLPEMAPAHARKAVGELGRPDLTSAEADQLIDSASGVARVNLAAALCQRFPGHFDRVVALANAHAQLTPAIAANAITNARTAAGFVKPDPDLLTPAIAKLVEDHAKIALSTLAAAEHPGRAMTAIVRLKERNDKLAGFVDVVTRHYDQWSAPKLRNIGDTIEAEIKHLRADPKLAPPVMRISSLLLDWDEYSQPAQLIAQGKGLNEQRSLQLIQDLRGLCLWLANDQHAYGQALTISRAVLHSFSELPWVAQQVPGDIATLEGLVKEEADQQRFGQLYRAVEQATANVTDFGEDVMRTAFWSGSGGMAKALYDAVVATAELMRKGEKIADPWLFVRGLTLAMHNEHALTNEAHTVVKVLVGFADAMPEDVAEQIKQDERTLRRQIKMGELSKAAQRQDADAAIRLADEMISITDDPEERQAIAQIRHQAHKRKSARFGKLVFGGIVVAVIVIAVIASNESTPKRGGQTSTTTYTPNTTSSSGSSTSASSTPSATSSVTAVEDEEKPPVGTSLLLTRNQVRYCVYQGERIDYLRPLILSAGDTERFNAMVGDYNARCSQFQYREGVLQEIENGLWLVRPKLKVDAERIARTWALAAAVSGNQPILPDEPANPVDAGLLDPTIRAHATLIQQRLRDLGYYTGAVDGKFGPGSKTALILFKQARRLGLDDTWTIATQTALFGQP